MTQAQLDLHNLQTQLQQPSSDLTTQPLLNDSPTLFLEPLDTSEPDEPTEHTTFLKVHTPPNNSHETPLPSKEDTKLRILFFSLHQYIRLFYLPIIHVQQTVMIV